MAHGHPPGLLRAVPPLNLEPESDHARIEQYRTVMKRPSMQAFSSGGGSERIGL